MRSLICETLVTGGTRHGKHEELCEDCAGVITSDKGTIFFLADATSDEGKAGPFSSRYLANTMGYWFLEEGLRAISHNDSPVDVEQVFTQALGKMENAWIREWKAFCGKPGAIPQIIEECEPFRSESGGRGVLKSFSTTFLGGVITSDEPRVKLVRIGDIDIVVKRAGHKASYRPVRKERIFSQIIIPAGKAPELRFSDTSYEVYEAGMIEFIIAKTDGLRFFDDEIAIRAMSRGGVDGVLEFRKVALKGINSHTGDDKALFYAAFL